MNRVVLSFLITSLAGLSTMIGSLLIIFKFKNEKKIISSSLFFASGVMISVSLIDLIPESFNLISTRYNFIISILLILIFINIGIIVSMLLNKKISFENESKLYKVGIISMIAIILHNIPEGIATFIATSTNVKLGISFGIAIALHNIPEGISISIPIYYASNSKKRAFKYTFISGLSELLGAVITYLFLKPLINSTILSILFSLIAGIMLYISFYELLPTAIKYNSRGVPYFILGVLVMVINKLIY